MIKKFNSIIYSMIAISIITILVGIAMICWPVKSIYTFALLTGCYFIVHGIVQIVMGFKASKYHLPYDGTAFGVLSLIFGILAVVVFAKNPEATTISWALFMGIALGISIIVSGVYNIKAAMLLKKVPRSNWVLILILGILTIILGILMISVPFTGALAETMFIGIFLTAFGVVNLVDTISLKTQAKQYENAVKKKVDDISDIIDKGVDTAADLYKEGKEAVDDQIDKFTN